MPRPVLILAAWALLLAGCPRSDGSPPSPPESASPRVVSLTPSLTAIVVALDAADHLVGVTTWCRQPGVPIVGDMRPDPERVVAARPDLILAGRYPSLAGDVASLRARGLQVLEVELDSLDDARRAFRVLGEQLDAAETASQLVARLEGALADARRRAEARPGDAPRVLLVFDVADGYVYTTGGGDHLAEILAATGAVNVAAGGPLTSRLAIEQVLRLAPDVIVHTAPSDRLPDDAAARAFWARHPTVPAVAAGRVYVWPDDRLSTHGPELAGAITRLSKLLDTGAL